MKEVGLWLLVIGAEYLILVICIFWWYKFLRLSNKTKKEIIVFTLCLTAAVFLVSRIAGWIYLNPRPIAVWDYRYSLFGQLSYNGFPSDHTCLGFLAAMTMYRYDKRCGLGAAFLAGLVGLSRVLVGVHHDIDVLMSIFIVIVVYVLINSIHKQSIDNK